MRKRDIEEDTMRHSGGKGRREKGKEGKREDGKRERYIYRERKDFSHWAT